ncbi:MAG: bacteriocin [Firmicutes bacterium]|nr:bacteriocin [Bacillota bacterium]
MKAGKKLSEDELKSVSGGTGRSPTVIAVGNPYRMPCKQERCPRCRSTELKDQLFTIDNGWTVYNGQECECGNVMIYGDSIM